MVEISQSLMDHLLLVLSIHIFTVIEFSSRAFKLVRGRSSTAHLNNFLAACLSISALDVVNLTKEFTDTFKLLLLILNNIFISAEMHIIFIGFNLINNLSKEFLHDTTTHDNEIIPPLWVILVNGELWLDTVVHASHEAGPGNDHIIWVPGDEKHLVRTNFGCVWRFTRMVCFADPDSVICDCITFDALDLQGCGGEKGHTGTCCDTEQSLSCLSQERVA